MDVGLVEIGHHNATECSSGSARQCEVFVFSAAHSPFSGGPVWSVRSRNDPCGQESDPIHRRADYRPRSPARAMKRFSAGKVERIYSVHLIHAWQIDGSVEGSGAEFINHSCDPNLTVRKISGQIFLCSLKKIRSGAELTADYGFRCSRSCNCGSRHCRGTMCHI